jgi:23S rRNA G2445 N2-methylase RlmL
LLEARSVTARRAPDFDLDRAIAEPGFTPRRDDVPELVERVARGAENAAQAERALLRVAELAAGAVIARAGAAEPAARTRLLRLASKLATSPRSEALIAFLVAGLADDDERPRRAAATALGKVRTADVSRALADALAREPSGSVRRALIEALGKAGGDEALVLLDALALGSPALALPERSGGSEHTARVHAKARLMAERTLRRTEPAWIDIERPPPAPMAIEVRCRAGLERFVIEELGADARPSLRRDEPGGPRISAVLGEPLASMYRSRTMLSFAFPLAAVPVRTSGDIAGPVVEALTSPAARAILAHYTRGVARYRLAWARGGKRRALVFEIAAAVKERSPELINDPTQSLWDVVVYEGAGVVRVELTPRIPDPRFAYRRQDVPAASHPTIAAALARAGGVSGDDVVWDPFVGSGLELCERSLLGPYRMIVGSDRDPAALAAARANLSAAGVPDERLRLLAGDAIAFSPPMQPTLIVTNPPLGRRVERSSTLAAMLDRFIEHAAGLLAPRGRLVWVSPFPERTLAVARRCQLAPTLVQPVDLGGFTASLQAFVKQPQDRRA